MSPHPTAPPASVRRGFSLVELMVVIVIIAILVAMLLPAIGSISRTSQITRVSVEIKSLESGITSFGTEFGIAPPSGITLFEEAGAWSGDVPSQTLIRRLWPQFNFALDRDINGDGDKNDIIKMTGAECLVFFLGGVTATNYVDAAGAAAVPAPAAGAPISGWTPLGFSKNPRNPFERGGGTRIGPFHEFDGARLVNLFSITSTNQGMPEFLDSLPSQAKPYLYATSYDGRGYDANDLGGPGLAALTPPLSPVTSMTNVYLQKVGASSAGNVPWSQTGFQIISPGFDTEYGLGGLYETDQLISGTGREDERDNITNFSGGQLN